MKNNIQSPKHTPGKWDTQNTKAKEFYDECDGPLLIDLKKLKTVNQSNLKDIVLDASEASSKK